MREGVLQPDFYDPGINPLYRDVLKHYGAVALPCRVRDPDRKGKVESGVGHAQKTPLQGKKFESLEEGQAHLDHWEERWADTRIPFESPFRILQLRSGQDGRLLDVSLNNSSGQGLPRSRYGDISEPLSTCCQGRTETSPAGRSKR